MADRTVELTERAYEALDEYRGPDQTMSDAILELVEADDDGLAHGEGIDRDALGATERAVVEVIDEQIAATEDRDVMGYLETMHPRARTDELQQHLVQLWSQYDLDYEFTIRDVTVEGNEAVADVVQTTEKVSGPEFADNTVLERFSLAMDDGQWWVVDSETVRTEIH